MFSIFIIVWFTAGNAWIYGTVDKKQINKNYCDPISYSIAFWIVTGLWLLVLLFCAFCFVALLIILISNGQNKIEETNII